MLASLGDPYTRFLSPAEVLNFAAAAFSFFFLFFLIVLLYLMIRNVFFLSHAIFSFRRWGGMTSLVLE
jgi:hypothetical protein